MCILLTVGSYILHNPKPAVSWDDFCYDFALYR